MSDEIKDADKNMQVPSRRKLLKLGAAGVPMIVSMRGGSAWAQSSIRCDFGAVTIPASAVSEYDDENFGGANTGGNAVPLAEQSLNADQIEQIFSTETEFTTYDTAYTNYLGQINMEGVASCLASVNYAEAQQTFNP